ncbi:hypothetical protein FA95DRAFT_1389633 [Auriscalpium vulgare]|uniref:Uncharacterized protein n=1 Tax=Auriscalpium vulgare TaxID=40419 RepID=A0ACB8S784_9AGAM|nr:hypothetical protein FA95DRAFT_1389633 [Auriscalpium vulgare]
MIDASHLETLPPLTGGDGEPGERISARFSSANSDVMIRSSDDVVFKLIRRDLAAYSEIFPGEDVDTHNEVVLLTEDAETLELLFQYTCRQPLPILDDVPFEKVAKLAEAAEKYRVFSAMAICQIRMKAAVQQHPLAVLGYAARHGYASMCDEAAPLTIDTPSGTFLQAFGPAIFMKWVLYRDEWIRLHHMTLKKPRAYQLHKGGAEDCELWAPFFQEVTVALSDEGSLPLLGLDKVIESLMASKSVSSCTQCHSRATNWRRTLETARGRIPLFSTIRLPE